jgi:hypothetical protein
MPNFLNAPLPSSEGDDEPVTWKAWVRAKLSVGRNFFMEREQFDPRARQVADADGMAMDPGATQVLWNQLGRVPGKSTGEKLRARVGNVRDVVIFGAASFCIARYLDHFAL